jgi:serine/threonine-protein kinase
MAVVYLARDLQHDRWVALKVLRPELGAVAGGDRFHREIRLVAQLVHPHILPLLDSGETAGRLWYTMPFIEGESLRARLDREKQLSLEEAIRLTREIAEALSYAHARDILHRDIKPDNILLSDGHALVADFGIARAIAGGPGERLTETGIAVGTPGYMSPEQSTGESRLDARTDLYALGSVCYEMLVGEPPFTGPTAQAVIARRLSQPPPSLRSTRPGLPEALDVAVQRALAPVPADRFESTAEFSRALAGAMAPEPTTTTSRGRPLAPALTAPIALTALIALAALTASATLIYRLVTRPTGAVSGTPSPTGGVRIAVVPFRLIGHDSADQYLADGITQEINSTLANLSGLRVIAQSSVAPVAQRGKASREIGAALGADALVEGDVQRAGTAVRVRVTLIDPATEESRWSQEYDHTTQDVFKIQSEVASRVAALLRIQLAERESRSLGRLPTTNPDAYDLYLRAGGQSDPPDRPLPSLDSAIAKLTGAIQLDSNFAAAWALRARHLSESVFLYDADPARLDQAAADIARALALDSTLAVAWDARSDLEWSAVRGWHFPEALADVRHALILQPSLVVAHTRLAALYFHYGFLAEARRELDASLSLDPGDGCNGQTRCGGASRPRVARVLWYGQQLDSALAVYQKLPYLGGFVWEYAVVLTEAGRPADGLHALDSALALNPGVREPADRVAARALAHAALGQKEAALGFIAATPAHPDSRSHSHHAQFTIACAFARLGRKADAVDWLRRAAENGLPNYPLFRNDPSLKTLQGDSAYEALMAGLKGQFEEWGRLVGR